MKPASCTLCSETWSRDPRLEVPCPTCGVAVGRRCKRPSEHQAPEPHVHREEAACAAGFLSRECPANPRPTRRAAEQLQLEATS